MRVERVTANLHVDELAAARPFYTDYLGLSVEEFSLGWVARYSSPTTGASLQLVTVDATAAEVPAISLHVDDVEDAYAGALKGGFEIVHRLTTEDWGVRRFMVRAPDGNVLNIVQHRD
jgi:catechol 2,3-dioxygenase-like lactoylglutathione lyase family enzyme